MGFSPMQQVSWTQVAERITQMHRYIHQQGWTQGTLIAPRGVCLYGAFLFSHAKANAAAEDTQISALLADAIHQLFPERAGGWIAPVPGCGWAPAILFNDDRQTSLADVHAVLARARELALRNAMLAGEQTVTDSEPPDMPSKQQLEEFAIEVKRLFEIAAPELVPAG